jgi:hypothetical protein
MLHQEMEFHGLLGTGSAARGRCTTRSTVLPLRALKTIVAVSSVLESDVWRNNNVTETDYSVCSLLLLLHVRLVSSRAKAGNYYFRLRACVRASVRPSVRPSSVPRVFFANSG